MAKDEGDQHGSMDSTLVEKQKLIDTLTTNRGNHRAIFEQALVGYRARAIELLEEHIARISAGKVEKVEVYLPIPEDHTEDYDRAVELLQWETRDKIMLSRRDFETYVLDRWTWMNEFNTTSQQYTRT